MNFHKFHSVQFGHGLACTELNSVIWAWAKQTLFSDVFQDQVKCMLINCN